MLKKILSKQKCIFTSGLESSISTYQFRAGHTEKQNKKYTCNAHVDS